MNGNLSVLVLDAGGVLINEPIPELLATMAREGGATLPDVTDFFESHLYAPLWSGSMSKGEFWKQLISFTKADFPAERWEEFFTSRLTSLPALEMLSEWRMMVGRLIVLSNHLAEWLRPALRPFIENRTIDHLLISSETTHVKPDQEAFLDIFRIAKVTFGSRVLFVDDRPENVEVATSLDMTGILADTGHSWFRKVSDWIEKG